MVRVKAMNDLPMNSEEGEKDPLGPMKALTGPYLRMGMPGVMRPRIKSLAGDDSTRVAFI